MSSSSRSIMVPNCFTLVDSYLKSTAIEFNYQLFNRKKGICIGSSVALYLADVCLVYLHQQIDALLERCQQDEVFDAQYVDSILI